jgi:hypothetical protein
MNAYSSGSAPHLDDDALLRLIDDDGDDRWRADTQQHLASCILCTQQLESLAADGALIRDWLHQAAFEEQLPPARLERDAAAMGPRLVGGDRPVRTSGQVPRVHVNSAWLRAAAILLMIAAPVAAFPGLRAWISDAVTGADPAAEVRTLAAPQDVATDQAVVRFTPQPGAFTVVVDAAQQAGVLHVSRTLTGDEAILEAAPQPGEAPAEPVFAETSLRLRNTTEAAASYNLVLPPLVTSVSITVAGSEIARLSGADLDAGTAVPLRRR